MSEGPGKISLEDNSDSLLPSDTEKMSEGQGTTEDATQDKKGGAQPEEGETQPEESGASEQKSSWYSKPEGFGNSAGDKIQSGLAPVSNTVGTGLEKVAGPVGGLVEPLVGGVMKTGEAFGTQANVGFGNKGGGPAKQAEAEGERMKEPLGGKEQNADNPLGL